MEIVEEEDSEGIILVQGMLDRNNIKGYVFHYHEGFMTWYQLKDEEAKQLLADNGGSEILSSPRSRNFRHEPLRCASLFFIPICLLCDVCCFCYLHLPHQIIYFVCPILIPDYCRPRVCVNVYRFSQGLVSIAPIAMAIGIFFYFPICADIFFLILELQNLVSTSGFSETLHKKSNPISDISV